MLPNHKNTINVAPPNKRFFNKRIQNFIFQINHQQNSVRGANLVPVAVPLSLKYFILCSKTMFSKTHSTERIKLSVEMVWSSRLSSAFRIASRPSLCKIFCYNPTTSIVRIIKLSGKSQSLLSFFKKSFVSCINHLTFCDNGFKWYSKKAEMFSVKNPLFEIIRLPGTFCSRLWILGNR